MRLTYRGKKDPQVIIDFSCSCDCRSWVRAGTALFDGDGRRQAFNEIDIRLFHLIEELPRISGKALDVAALPFRIKRIESERGFSRAAQPGDNHQLLPGNLHVEVLEIVLA